MHRSIYTRIISATMLICFCQTQTAKEIKHYPLSNLDDIITKTSVQLDREVSFDDNGSFLITAADTHNVIRLIETEDIDVDDARLVYTAQIRSEDVKGQVYLEMWCGFKDKGEFFSRGLHSTISGSRDWTKLESQFFLKKGENPDFVKLNIVIEGPGTVWIDDIRLMKGPLNE